MDIRKIEVKQRKKNQLLTGFSGENMNNDEVEKLLNEWQERLELQDCDKVKKME